MFDFRNLDEIDEDTVAPEWEKWSGVPQWQRAEQDDLAVLEDDREEQYAAPDEDTYVFEKLDIPALPEEDNFDPVGLIDDTVDAIEDRMASYNGQVILSYVSGAFEEYMMLERERDERKAYLTSLHKERLAILESQGIKPSEVVQKESLQGRSFDRKKFAWREIQAPLCQQIVGLPDGGAWCEAQINGNTRILKSLTKVAGCCVMPTSTLIQILCCAGAQTRPMPSTRMGRNAEWYLQLTEVFFPACFVLDDGSEVFKNLFEGNGGPPTLVHAVAMTISKEAGALEAKKLLENIKLTNDMNKPRRRQLG